MTTIRQPRRTFNIVPASTVVTNTEQKILFVGQKLAAGSATAGQLVENIANGGAEDALFGEKSMLANLIRAMKERNSEVRADAISLDDSGTAVDATGTLVWASTATEAGSYEVIVGSERNSKYSIAVAVGDTATVVGDAVVAAITADTAALCSAANVTGTVTCTAENGGTFGNSIPLEIRGQVAGLTTSVTAMTGGLNDPVLTSVFDVIGNARYQAIVWPYPSDTSVVRALLDARFNVSGQVLDGVAFTAINDTFANLGTLASPLNSQSLVIFGGKLESETNYKGGDIVEVPMVKAAIFAGLRGLRLDSNGYSISDLVISSNGALDSFGGPALASKPYFNTIFSSLFAIKTGRGFVDDAELESLKDGGISFIGNNVAGNGVICGEVVTTYKNDSAGNPDLTYRFLNYVDTYSQCREYFFNNNGSRFAQSRLTNGELKKGRDMANPGLIRSYQKRVYRDLSGENYVLLEGGQDALDYFNENLVVTVVTETGTSNVQMDVLPVVQLRNMNATMRISFSI